MALAVMHAVGRFSVASHANNEFCETRNPAKQYANSKLPVLTYGRSGFACVAKLIQPGQESRHCSCSEVLYVWHEANGAFERI